MFFNLKDKELKSLTTYPPDAGFVYHLQMTLDLSKLDDKVYLLPRRIALPFVIKSGMVWRGKYRMGLMEKEVI